MTLGILSIRCKRCGMDIFYREGDTVNPLCSWCRVLLLAKLINHEEGGGRKDEGTREEGGEGCVHRGKEIGRVENGKKI